MTDPSLVLRILERWVALVVNHSRLTLALLLLITAWAGYFAVDRYAMNSRLGDLVQQDGGWREDYEAFQAAFPQLVETAIVVVSGESSEEVEETAIALETAIVAEQDLFTDVYAPANERFFSDNAFLYMDLAELDRVSDQLAQAQPVLAAVARDPSLRSLLELAVTGASDSAGEGYFRTVSRLSESAAAASAGRDASIRWRDEFLGADTAAKKQSYYRLIFLRGKQNFGVALPNAEIVARLRTIIEEVGADHNLAAALESGRVRIALTGEIALRHDEVYAATDGVKISGTVALVLLALVLAFGVRSLRVVLATFSVLLMGSVWTAAWAMLAIGSFNTLSLVFLVMFFGLGVDFCVHYCLRVQEVTVASRNEAGAGSQPRNSLEVLKSATRGVGGAVLLCTITTAIGFLGFLPTPYKGLADLGVISAGGMAVACILTFTLLPALFAEFGLPQKNSLQLRMGDATVSWLSVHKFGAFSILGLLVAGCLWLLPRMQFDYSVLALRDPSAESMLTLRELQREGQITDYALYTLAQPEALARQRALQNLDTVDRVITPLDYLPKDQEEKLFALEDLQGLLGETLEVSPERDKPSVEELRRSIREASASLKIKLAEIQERPVVDLLSTLTIQLDLMADGDDTTLLAWQDGVVKNLVREIERLGRAIQASGLSFQDLPAGLRARLVAADGRYLSAVLPAVDITPVAELNRFVNSVRNEFPEATGRPVVEWGVGNIVLDSFRLALLVALGGISLVLLVVLRSFRDTILVLTPLLLAALFAVATSVVFGVPLNMASVLVLPLIFGLGVDNGIHMVERYRSEQICSSEFMQSSTPRAVLLSTLTTIGTFAALMLSPHAGTASIGFLLTVAIGYLLLFSVFLLPVLLSMTADGASRVQVAAR